jgi:hypothetical protein
MPDARESQIADDRRSQALYNRITRDQESAFYLLCAGPDVRTQLPASGLYQLVAPAGVPRAPASNTQPVQSGLEVRQVRDDLAPELLTSGSWLPISGFALTEGVLDQHQAFMALMVQCHRYPISFSVRA